MMRMIAQVKTEKTYIYCNYADVEDPEECSNVNCASTATSPNCNDGNVVPPVPTPTPPPATPPPPPPGPAPVTNAPTTSPPTEDNSSPPDCGEGGTFCLFNGDACCSGTCNFIFCAPEAS